MRPIVTEQNSLRNPLNDLLGMEAHIRLLRVLSREVDGPLSASDAAERAGLTVRGAQKALKRLLQTGFVLFAGGGRKPQYELRHQEDLVKAVVKLFHVEAERYEKLMGAIREKIGTTEPPPLSAWIEVLPTGVASPILLGVMHETRYLSSYINKLTLELREIEQEFDVTVEVKGYTKADVPVLKQGEVVHLYGIYPYAQVFFSDSKDKPRTHEETDRHLLELARILSSYIEKDTSIVKRAKEHVKRLLEREQGTATRDIEEWHSILKTYSLRRLSQFLTSASERANRLRQSCPLFTVLTADERSRLLNEIGRKYDT